MSNKKHRYYVLYTTNNYITEPYAELDSAKYDKEKIKRMMEVLMREAQMWGYKDLHWRIEWDY